MDLSSTWPLATERLRLRPLTHGDVEAVLAYRSLPEVCRYVPFEPMTRDDVLDKLAGRWGQTRFAQDGDGAVVAIARADDDRVIGDLSLFYSSAEHRTGEIGWILDPAHGGRGYATEAVWALLHVAFGICDLHRVVARVDTRNLPSLALARRVGMRQEAHLIANEWFKGAWSDEIDFALLAAEWGARRPGDPCRGGAHDVPSVGTRSAIESTIREGRNG